MFFMTKIIYTHTHTHTHTHTIFGWINISNILSEKYSEKKNNPGPCLEHSTYPIHSSSMLYGDLNEKDFQKRGDMCIHILDSPCCTAETNTAL